MNYTLAIALAVLLICVAPLVGICIGAFSGFIVGLVFPGTMAIVGGLFTAGQVVPAWQVGAILGFVGGFFKTHVTLRDRG